MGLAISVGILADLLMHDSEGAEWCKASLAAANRILAANDLPLHEEPTQLPPFQSRAACTGFPYSFLHYLRRASAHVIADKSWKATPVPDDIDPADDPLVDDELGMFTSHLICHSDSEGYYVPVDFPEVLVALDGFDDLPGGILGSTQRLQAELIEVAPALGICLTEAGMLADAEAARINEMGASDAGLYREMTVWIALYEAARLSLAHQTAIVFH
ncbi:MAG: hypothetical protein K1Y36_10630 [Blastocatellia bacterium]|nr:hypothetical protein [Blastocatellia bacterium]